MFGKEQPEVVTEEQVGDYVAELYNTTPEPIDEVCYGITDLVGRSEEPTTGTQD